MPNTKNYMIKSGIREIRCIVWVACLIPTLAIANGGQVLAQGMLNPVFSGVNRIELSCGGAPSALCEDLVRGLRQEWNMPVSLAATESPKPGALGLLHLALEASASGDQYRLVYTNTNAMRGVNGRVAGRWISVIDDAHEKSTGTLISRLVGATPK